MDHRLGAGLLTTLMSLALGASLLAAAPANAVDTAPPPVGSCHDLSYSEAYAEADPDPAVDCTTHHTTVTVRILRFKKAPDWNDYRSLRKRIVRGCSRGQLQYFDGRARRVQKSAYGTYAFLPTQRQRRAGAKWIRCDLALLAPNRMPPLPTDGDPTVDGKPMPDSVAKCRVGKKRGFAVTPCARKHRFRATTTFRWSGASYPGFKRMQRFTYRKCQRRIGGPFYYEWPSRLTWQAGLRFSVCYRQTRD